MAGLGSHERKQGELEENKMGPGHTPVTTHNITQLTLNLMMKISMTMKVVIEL